MKLKLIISFVLLVVSFSTFAEKIELFDPIPGAIKYEIWLKNEAGKSFKIINLKSPKLESNSIPGGNYEMKARFQNVREKWSEWSSPASLKILKKIKNNTNNVFEVKFPFGASIGFLDLNTELTTDDHTFTSNESVIRTRGTIQRQAFKINVAFDKSNNLTRLDSAILKQITPRASTGVNFWMVNFDGRSKNDNSKGLINYTQAFVEFDYMYPFLERWYAGAKIGLGLGISYFVKPEITYSIPFGKDFYVSSTLIYEANHVKQSSFEFDAHGFGGLINLNYFLEI